MHFQGEIVKFFLKNDALRSESVKDEYQVNKRPLLDAHNQLLLKTLFLTKFQCTKDKVFLEFRRDAISHVHELLY